MKKLILVSTGFAVAIITILLFQVKAGTSEINKSLNTVQQKQMNLDEKISKLDLQLNNKITELSKDSEDQNRNLGIALNEVKSSSLMEIEEVNRLIVSYTEEVKNKNRSERLLIVNALVESDNSTQQLLGEGSLKYKKRDFTAAIKVYRNILDADPSNTEALCYFNASLYYQNPGDGSNFSGIKKDLISLLEEKVLTKDEKLTALNILIGISMEESDSDSVKQYQNVLQELKES